MKQFPVLTLSDRINEVFGKIVSIDIMNNIESGVDSQVMFVDEEGKLTDIASIGRYKSLKDSKQHYRVRVSAAYAQILWLLCEAVLWTHDSLVAKSEFPQLNKQQLSMLQSMGNANPNSELSYIAYLVTRNGVDVARNFELVNIITSRKVTELEMEELYRHSTQSQFGTYVNSLYVYAMSFILLHELSHHDLDQDFTKESTLDDEINADEHAFWSLHSDMTAKEHTTAMHGVVCAMMSLLFIPNPLAEDETHPRPFERVFRYYHIALNENSKEKMFLRTMLFCWACYINNRELIEKVCDHNKSMEEIESYLYDLEKK